MESLQNILELIRPGVYMASIDLKDAFCSVPVHKNHQAYLTFFVEEQLKFVCVPNGYGPAVRICIDDCFSNVLNTIEILRSLGFTIHSDKSKLILTHTSPIYDLF